MAASRSFLLAGALFCLAYVRTEVVDLQPALSSTETTLQSAKTHVDHMLNLSPIPNEEKLKPIVKNESDHLAYEIKQFATKLHDKVAVGEHKAEIKDAVSAAVTQLNEAAASLEHVGSDLKQDNVKFYTAAEKVIQEARKIVSAGPCDQLAPIVKAALEELTHDVNNYQYGIHEVVGPHEGAPTEAGHVHDHGNHHHVHQHHGASSEESKESQESHEHHEHHHH